MAAERDGIAVPEHFARWRVQSGGDADRAWILKLPALVGRLAERWGLVVEDTPPLHGAVALVVLVRRGGEDLALRLSPPDQDVATEADALRAWNGRGTVRLLDADPAAGALLLERLDHRRSLHTVPLWEAAEIAGATIRDLAIAPPPGLRTLSQIASGIADGLLRRWHTLGGPVPLRWVHMAAEYASDLPHAGDQLLVHADLHYGNILRATRQPWLATDPRPIQGPPEYSVPELIWSRADDLRSSVDVRRLVDTVVSAAGLDAALTHGWVVTRCVDYWLWGLERGLTIDPARCERVLGALVPGPPA